MLPIFIFQRADQSLLALFSRAVSQSLLNTTNWHFGVFLSGGGERIRTDDLLRAKQALSQLSYTPKVILKI